jgi:hypothetical protein
VQRKITSLWSEEKVVLRQTPRAVTRFGGLSVFIEFLGKIGFSERVCRDLPAHLKSTNAIDLGETFTAFLISVVAGARRFAHSSLVRADPALHALLGMERFPSDGTIRNFFKRFRQGAVVRLYEPLWAWQLERLPKRAGGYSLDLDSTVFERYGKQQGVKKGYNPRKPGRGSHHPLLAVLGEAYFILHGWLRTGNTRADSGVVEFLKEALAKLESREWVRRVRADAGFFAEELLQYLEELKLGYIVVARLTPWLKREATRVKEWRALGAIYPVGEFPLQLLGWDRERRFVVVREEIRESKPSVGRKLFEVPGYTFRLFVTNLADPPEEIWRDYNQRAWVCSLVGRALAEVCGASPGQTCVPISSIAAVRSQIVANQRASIASTSPKVQTVRCSIAHSSCREIRSMSRSCAWRWAARVPMAPSVSQ